MEALRLSAPDCNRPRTYTQLAYSFDLVRKAVFFELPAFPKEDGGSQFWLFTLYDKDEMADLSADEKKALKSMLKAELEVRR